MTQDAEFYDGFDKYGPTGKVVTVAEMGGEWNSILTHQVGAGTVEVAMAVADSLVADGHSLQISVDYTQSNNAAGATLYKTLPGAYARCMGSMHISDPLSSNSHVGVAFLDGTTYQLSIVIDGTTGRISVRSGNGEAAAIVTSDESVAASAGDCIQWDVTFHNTSGIIKLWLNGVSIIALTGQDTIQTSNASISGLGPSVSLQNLGAGVTRSGKFDHFKVWLWTASGGGETPPLTNPIVETQFPVEDVVSDFAFGAGILGSATRVVTTTNAPGANRLSLIQVTAEIDSTLDSISIVPAASSAGAKFKGVAYADNGDTPDGGALLSTGTEVVGCTSGVQLDLPLATPPGVTAGDKYWLGYITDTSIAIRARDGLAQGRGAANTYGSGAPDPAPATTALLTTWLIWGNVSAVAENWPEVNENPPVGDLSYVEGDTVGDQDLFNFAPLASTPTVIYGMAVKANMKRTDGGARTIDLIHKAGATTGTGLQPGRTPATTYGWIASYYREDPDTSAAFNESGINAGQSGYEIAS